MSFSPWDFKLRRRSISSSYYRPRSFKDTTICSAWDMISSFYWSANTSTCSFSVDAPIDSCDEVGAVVYEPFLSLPGYRALFLRFRDLAAKSLPVEFRVVFLLVFPFWSWLLTDSLSLFTDLVALLCTLTFDLSKFSLAPCLLVLAVL